MGHQQRRPWGSKVDPAQGESSGLGGLVLGLLPCVLGHLRRGCVCVWRSPSATVRPVWAWRAELPQGADHKASRGSLPQMGPGQGGLREQDWVGRHSEEGRQEGGRRPDFWSFLGSCPEPQPLLSGPLLPGAAGRVMLTVPLRCRSGSNVGRGSGRRGHAGCVLGPPQWGLSGHPVLRADSAGRELGSDSSPPSVPSSSRAPGEEGPGECEGLAPGLGWLTEPHWAHPAPKALAFPPSSGQGSGLRGPRSSCGFYDFFGKVSLGLLDTGWGLLPGH